MLKQRFSEVLLLFLLLAFAVLAFLFPWADSELWTLQTGLDLSRHLSSPWLWTRLAWPLILHPLSWFPLEQSSLMVLARGFGLVNGFLLLWGYARLAQMMGLRREQILLCLILLLSQIGFLSQGFLLRADLLGCSLVLWLPWFRQSLWPLLLALSFLISPKIPLLFLVHLPFLLALKGFDLRTTAKPWLLRLTVAGLLALFLSFFFYPALGAFIWRSFLPSAEGPGAFLPLSFLHLGKMVLLAPWLPCLILIGFLLGKALPPWGLAPRVWSGLRVSIQASLLVLLCFPEKVPFFIASYLPLLTLWAAGAWEQFWQMPRWMPLRPRGHPVVLSVLTLVALVLVGLRLHDPLRRDQVQFLTRLESYLEMSKPILIYDGLGLTRSAPTLPHFVGPHEIGNRELIPLLKAWKPDLLLTNERLKLLEPEFSQELASLYQADNSGIWFRVFPLEGQTPAARVETLANLLLDRGKTWESPVFAKVRRQPQHGVVTETIIETKAGDLRELILQPQVPHALQDVLWMVPYPRPWGFKTEIKSAFGASAPL